NSRPCREHPLREQLEANRPGPASLSRGTRAFPQGRFSALGFPCMGEDALYQQSQVNFKTIWPDDAEPAALEIRARTLHFLWLPTCVPVRAGSEWEQGDDGPAGMRANIIFCNKTKNPILGCHRYFFWLTYFFACSPQYGI